jgi:hypothetical protein
MRNSLTNLCVRRCNALALTKWQYDSGPKLGEVFLSAFTCASNPRTFRHRPGCMLVKRNSIQAQEAVTHVDATSQYMKTLYPQATWQIEPPGTSKLTKRPSSWPFNW